MGLNSGQGFRAMDGRQPPGSPGPLALKVSATRLVVSGEVCSDGVIPFNLIPLIPALKLLC